MFFLYLEVFSRQQTSSGLAYISRRQKERQKKWFGSECIEPWSHLTLNTLSLLLKTREIGVVVVVCLGLSFFLKKPQTNVTDFGVLGGNKS